jgi:ABC-2 type transport system ATP-binding protein
VLFLDEPTVGLDPRIRHELLDVVAGLRASHELTILVTTHYLDEAERLADRVAIVHEGMVVALDSPKALLERLGSEILEFRVEGEPHAALAALKLQRLADDDAFVVGARVTVPLHGHTATEVLAGLRAHASEISTRVPTLDDVYLQLTGGRLAQAA